MLSPIAIERLNKVRLEIIRNSRYYSRDQDVSKDWNPKLGTICDIPGWADYLFNGEKSHEARYKREFLNLELIDWFEIGKNALHLTEEQALKLLCRSSRWPRPYNKIRIERPSHRHLAIMVSARIEHFIRSNGLQ